MLMKWIMTTRNRAVSAATRRRSREVGIMNLWVLLEDSLAKSIISARRIDVDQIRIECAAKLEAGSEIRSRHRG